MSKEPRNTETEQVTLELPDLTVLDAEVAKGSIAVVLPECHGAGAPIVAWTLRRTDRVDGRGRAVFA